MTAELVRVQSAAYDHSVVKDPRLEVKDKGSDFIFRDKDPSFEDKDDDLRFKDRDFIEIQGQGLEFLGLGK